ncbi:MAG TPA: FAD-dependent oxidoreductase [Beijerinckiaceae bacterium]|jgi:2-polyprenyl-6-methoxyphenol hydroxylase-like FAD-dependent oxidoreductase|nr:2-polyprenyl-6-methoxyphenol hydroxylase [Microvirga sp.]HZB38147.1 FAD-dependent oxidoreductase [Beijerinckiaceae bacterium]
MTTAAEQCRCCIVGGGPAGMMLGFLLARAGIDVVVIEKHADFLRDFRGDTVHPSTLELMHELGLLDEFLKLPHEKVARVTGLVGEAPITIADFSHLPAHCRFIAFMPQWDFLDFLADHAKTYPAFRLRMECEATELLRDGERITGVRARAPEGEIELRADLVVAADGRHSILREEAGLAVEDFGAPMDALWMRLSRRPDDQEQPLGRFGAGEIFVMLNRGDYFQCALIIPKGGLDKLKEQGLEAVRARIAALAPFVADRVGELKSWDDLKLLVVKVDRLREWARPGLLCIGDAAHAMSPIGGVGINLAIQDAVAAANLLWEPLRGRTLAIDHLKAVQRRRELPVRLMQAVQVAVQNRIISTTLGLQAQPSLPWQGKLLNAVPFLRRIPARIMGLGFRPEHVRTPDVRASRPTPPAP